MVPLSFEYADLIAAYRRYARRTWLHVGFVLRSGGLSPATLAFGPSCCSELPLEAVRKNQLLITQLFLT